MTLCVRAGIGATGGAAGVRFEPQAAASETGAGLLSEFPVADDRLR